MMKRLSCSRSCCSARRSARPRAVSASPTAAIWSAGSLPAKWNTGGPKCMEMPEWQVHEYNPNLYILRQSGCTDAEMPFLYLFFGKDRGLLWDTGSRNGNLAPTLAARGAQLARAQSSRQHSPHRDALALARRPHLGRRGGSGAQRSRHAHRVCRAHGRRRVAGLRDRPVAHGASARSTSAAACSNIVPIPGHDKYADRALRPAHGHRAHRRQPLSRPALHSRLSRLTRQAPSVSSPSLRASPSPTSSAITSKQTRTPFKDFPIGSIYHPDEHCLELSFGTLLELEDGLKSMESAPHRMASRDFTIWPLDPKEEGLGPQMEEIYKRTQAEQLKNKWNQPIH